MEGICASAKAAAEAGQPWFFDPCLALGAWDAWLMGVWISLSLTVLSMILGFCLALPMAFAMVERVPALAGLARGFIYVFRGSPLLVQLFLIYYGLAQFDVVRESWFWRAPEFVRGTWLQGWWPSVRDAWWCALVAFALNSAAYQAEILRGAIAATPRGEKEAAVAVGMSPLLTARRILVPSALRRALPQLGNEAVFMLHGSAVASIVTIQDILGVGRMINGRFYVVYEGLFTAAALYMMLTYGIILAVAALEKRYLRHLRAR